jgi:hypothetical protein
MAFFAGIVVILMRSQAPEGYTYSATFHWKHLACQIPVKVSIPPHISSSSNKRSISCAASLCIFGVVCP